MNRRMMDMLMRRGGGRDGRNPYGSRGGYVSSSRRMRDGLMMDDMRMYNENPSDYNLADMTRQNREIEHDPYMPRDYARGRGSRRDYARGYENRGDYGTGEPYAGVDDFYERNDMARGGRGRDRAGDYADYDYARGRRDGHYGQMYYPIEAMGTFNGYYGMGSEYDYARGRRDYGYDYAGDYGENLTKQELEHWNKKLMQEVEEKDKAFFSKENVKKKAQEMGIKFDKFNEEEFYLTALMMYTDYCKTLGTANMDTYLRLAKDWLEDKDVSVKGGEKLAVYHDCIVQGD